MDRKTQKYLFSHASFIRILPIQNLNQNRHEFSDHQAEDQQEWSAKPDRRPELRYTLFYRGYEVIKAIAFKSETSYLIIGSFGFIHLVENTRTIYRGIHPILQKIKQFEKSEATESLGLCPEKFFRFVELLNSYLFYGNNLILFRMKLDGKPPMPYIALPRL